MTSAKADTHAGLFVKLLRRSIVGILLIQQQKHRIVLPVLLRLQIQIAPDADRIADPDKLPCRKPPYRDLIEL